MAAVGGETRAIARSVTTFSSNTVMLPTSTKTAATTTFLPGPQVVMAQRHRSGDQHAGVHRVGDDQHRGKTGDHTEQDEDDRLPRRDLTSKPDT